MDYFNIDDTNLESTSYTADDFDAYLFLRQTSTTEETNEIFADGCQGVGVQPELEVSSPRRLEVEASFDTVTSTTPYDTQTHSNGALSFPGYYCEGVQPDNEIGWSGSLEAEASFDTVTPTTRYDTRAHNDGVLSLPEYYRVGVQPDNEIDWSRSLEPEASFDAVTLATPYNTQAHNDGALSFHEYSWPVTGRYPQPHGPGIASWENSFTSTAASGASTVVPVPSSAPLDYWWNNESGSSTSTFHGMNVQAPHKHSTGLTRNVTVPTLRFRPYEAPNARLNEHTNAEAGPSTLMPPLNSYMAPPAMHPSGGLSEATADAENNQKVKEEDVAPKPRKARGTGRPRNWRIQYQRDMHRLRAWAKAWEVLDQTPTYGEALDTALGVIEFTRTPVYPEPRLKKGTNTRSTQGKKAPDAEHERRKGARYLNGELSRYYQLAVNKSVWERPDLLSKVLEELEELLELHTVQSA